MPTFLPFSRAVKAHAESLAVCGWLGLALLATSCVSQAVEHGRTSPPAGPVRAAPTHTPIGLASPLDGGAPSTAAAAIETSAPNANASAASNSIELSFEDPYPLDARPRASGPLQAAADDEDLARWNVGGTSDPSYVSSQASFHPGTRVVVDARFAARHAVRSSRIAPTLSAERVQAQARSKGYWPFRLCFEAGQREKKGLGGETRIRFTISRRGDVSSATLLGSELRNTTSSACLLSELRKLRFAPRPAKHIDVLTTIGIWPGDADLPPLSDSPPGMIETSAGFDPAVVRSRVTAKQSELSACFDLARRQDPSLWGRLAFAVVLEVDGTVHRVSEVESHFPNASASRCAAAALSAISFSSVNGKPFSFVLAMRLPPDQRRALPPAQSAPPDSVEPSTDGDDAGASD
jgi:hypothetical protein